MNQYIITENLLDRIYDIGFSRGCMERDEEHNQKLNALYEEVESRPYQSERDKVLEHVDEILKHEWANATNLDNPYRDDRHMVISRIRNTVAIYRKELRQKAGE